MSLVLLFAEGRHRTLACGVPGTVPFALPDAQNVNETELYELGRGARRGSKLCGDPRAGWGLADDCTAALVGGPADESSAGFGALAANSFEKSDTTTILFSGRKIPVHPAAGFRALAAMPFEKSDKLMYM